ncbi:DNA recombination protein RmuC [Mucilaginibacter gracilis]|uniref:DNA recombination protein RmuC n=1 Tax=Mucilaginibacter gracilis TaxID=423350 RepID=A0A495IX19_9SPHI|nr:DNA recombination protein RmuC [Mucilaginibacter gracilis]RKR81132.1 DNA recombination protein RmuC [Mucilaginibacter gracilis]
MEIALLAFAVVILTVAIVLFLRRLTATAGNQNQLIAENNELKLKVARTEERAANMAAERDNTAQALHSERLRLEAGLAALNEQLLTEKNFNAKTQEALNAQRQRLVEQEVYLQQVQAKFKHEFENMASKLLDDKSAKFTEHNRTNLDIILNPFKDKLKDFEDKVDKVYKMEAEERNVLRGVIGTLMDLNKQISEEAQNLTKALKGDNKKAGNWGEVILERVLERSGLVKDQEYRIQASMQTTDGNRYQPDVVIDLPDEKHLVIDAKVSLVAYERLVNCETEDDRKLFARAHIESIKSHINSLSSKRYHDLYQINSPDFVLLFVPIESSFSIAVQLDGELFNYAWDKRVVIVSPSTLLATLRTIASIWKQERQNRNVLEIARLSGEMYDKFHGFIVDMEGIGNSIRSTQVNYDKALNKLSTGRGNLTVTADKIKRLGAKADKQIDQKYLNDVAD